MIWANIGRYGPYLKHAETISHKGGLNANLEGIDEVWTVGMNRAVELLAQKAASRGRGRTPAQPIKELGDHPDGGAMSVMPGRYGPYVKWEKVNATIPKEVEPEALTFEMAVELVNERAAKSGKGRKKAPAKKKAATKKTSSKKAVD